MHQNVKCGRDGAGGVKRRWMKRPQVFRIMGKTLLPPVNQKSVHLYCYDSFKWPLHVFHRQLCNSYHCLVYVLQEDLNQISRTEKCHFAFHIFHEQRFHSFTSRFVKSRVFAWWHFLWFISICKYIYKLTTNKQTKANKKTKTKQNKTKQKDIPYLTWISGFYFVTVLMILTYRHMRKNVVVRKLKFRIWQYVIFSTQTDLSFSFLIS